VAGDAILLNERTDDGFELRIERNCRGAGGLRGGNREQREDAGSEAESYRD
jgi:hypothetical protein